MESLETSHYIVHYIGHYIAHYIAQDIAHPLLTGLREHTAVRSSTPQRFDASGLTRGPHSLRCGRRSVSKVRLEDMGPLGYLRYLQTTRVHLENMGPSGYLRYLQTTRVHLEDMGPLGYLG
ncbi:hypothetical protein EYF80_046419 [Liparis tanakae]|uniref:Uncharacterized protein n=1 Tax=Liparis tanakae TaxID=230148 RepID=A0A4Z2FR58_9TELE|nr:hypothetical protein EYF80_046419 [Liparis tanakae]